VISFPAEAEEKIKSKSEKNRIYFLLSSKFEIAVRNLISKKIIAKNMPNFHKERRLFRLYKLLNQKEIEITQSNDSYFNTNVKCMPVEFFPTFCSILT
jgi:hypothetical protein